MLYGYWSRVPTVRDMVAAYLDVKSGSGTTSAVSPATEEEMRRAMLMHGVAHG